MRTIMTLNESTRKQLIRMGRKTSNAATMSRFLMVATLGRGWTCTKVASILYCAISTVAVTVRRFILEGPDGLLDRRAHNGARKVDHRFRETLKHVLNGTPLDYGWERPTWTRELLALEMEQQGFPRVSVSTIGRALADIKARRGRPKPVVNCPWPKRKRQRVLRILKRLAEGASSLEPVFFADEVDIHLNPKIGWDWMNQGQQRLVITPGKNEKRYIAGALNAATGNITWVDGASKCSTLFCALVQRLIDEYPKAKCIHIILDNYIIHSSKITKRFLEQFGERVQLHFLPPYCPDHNRIERFWQDLHANVTRNHRCKTIKELLRHAMAFLSDYNDRQHCKPSLRRAIAVAA